MEKYLKLQASVFGDFRNIDLSQESMIKMYQIFLKENMMPSIMKEFDIGAQNMKNRPNFVANDNSISIAIGSNRIDIISDLTAGDKILEKDTFIELATKYLKEFFEVFNVNASRVSLILEGIVKIIDMSNDVNIEKRYLNTEHIYDKKNLIEWSSNSVSLDEWVINGKKEKVNLNITTALRRLNGMKNGQNVVVNGLVSIQDLNTIAENTALRLSIVDIAEFFKVAKEKSELISAVVEV